MDSKDIDIDITDDQKGRWSEPLFRHGAVPFVVVVALAVLFIWFVVAERELAFVFGAVCIVVLAYLNIRHRLRTGSWPS